MYKRARVGRKGRWYENVHVDQEQQWPNKSGYIKHCARVNPAFHIPQNNSLNRLGQAWFGGFWSGELLRQIILYEKAIENSPHRIGGQRIRDGADLFTDNDTIWILVHEVLHMLHCLSITHHLNHGK